MSKKSKRLKIEDRVTILRRLETGELSTNLATEYGITMSAISHMKKNKESILNQKQRLDDIQGNPARKRFTGIENTPLDRCLYDWYMQKQSLGDNVSGPILQEQALIFNKLLNGPETFKASHGFVAKFKKRYDLSSLSIQDEGSSKEEESGEKFFRELSQYLKMHDYGMDQVYYAVESGLLWKNLPERRSGIKVEPVDLELEDDGRKMAEDRVTTMVCTNASGTHKLPLLVVGNAKQPRCFKKVRFMPVTYRSRKCAWMDHDLILDWYREVFLPEITKRHRPTGEKCVLLLDNAPGRPAPDVFESLSDICRVKYFPKNAISQPMGQPVIDKFKNVCKRNLLRLALTEDSFEDIQRLLRSLTMLDCCNFLSSSWKEITEADIKNGWKMIFPCDIAFVDLNLEAEEFLKMIHQLPEYGATTLEETVEWLNQYDSDSGWKMLSDEVELSLPSDEERTIAQVEGDNLSPETSSKDALRGLRSLIAWYQTRWECTPQNIEFLEKLRGLAISEIISNKIQ